MTEDAIWNINPMLFPNNDKYLSINVFNENFDN